MKKRIVGLLTALCLLLAGGGLLGDFYPYRKNSKAGAVDKNKLIVSITAFDGASESKPFVKCLGHTWISLENPLDHPVFVSGCAIQPGEMMTASVWAIAGHKRTVFNLEPQFIEQYGRYAGRKSLEMNIEESQLGDMEAFMEQNDRWTATKNCTYWSIHLWNTLAPEEYRLPTQRLLYTPARLQKALLEYRCAQTDKDFSAAQELFFYENGERTELTLWQ